MASGWPGQWWSLGLLHHHALGDVGSDSLCVVLEVCFVIVCGRLLKIIQSVSLTALPATLVSVCELVWWVYRSVCMQALALQWCGLSCQDGGREGLCNLLSGWCQDEKSICVGCLLLTDVLVEFLQCLTPVFVFGAGRDVYSNEQICEDLVELVSFSCISNKNITSNSKQCGRNK